MEQDEVKKQCNGCQRWLLYDTEHFVPTKHGLSRKCKECNYAQVKAWRARPENKAKINAQAKRWRNKHPDVRQAIVDRHRADHLDQIRERDRADQVRRRDNDPDGARRRQRAYKQREEAARIALAGRPRPDHCELCGETAGTVFDHCHRQGHFRGWLCSRCNRVLGSVGDSVDLLRKMITYLEQANGSANGEATEGVTEESVRDPIEGAEVRLISD